MDKDDLGQLIAGVVMLVLVIGLAVIRRKIWVTTKGVTYTVGGVEKTLAKGAQIPDDEECEVRDGRKQISRSALRNLIVGKDQRASTSKTALFLWTVTVAFGLLSLLIASWLGDEAGLKGQVENGLQEEYLLFLGGPYAAAILAKYAAVTTAASDGKPPAPAGEAKAGQLIADDEGDTDLGDFQYLLFNLIALLFFYGEFVGVADKGFPDLPPLLTGLALASAGGYGAKKLLSQSRPTLTSVLPASAPRGATDLRIYGSNLVVPTASSSTGSSPPPVVAVGGRNAAVTAHEQILGADRLTVAIDSAAALGAGTISVVRADGIAAVGPAGADGIAFEVMAPAWGGGLRGGGGGAPPAGGAGPTPPSAEGGTPSPPVGGPGPPRGARGAPPA